MTDTKISPIGPNLWIAGGYYMEFDPRNQLVIVGPGNHLHFGSVNLYKDDLVIDKVEMFGDRLRIKARILHQRWMWHEPVIGHIRRVGGYIKVAGYKPTFGEVIEGHSDDLLPNWVEHKLTDKGYQSTYRREYGDHWYGVKVLFDKSVEVENYGRTQALRTNESSIALEITAESSLAVGPGISHIFKSGAALPKDLVSREKIAGLLRRSEQECGHLVGFKKTSGFDYGTVFPRDWMEAANLAACDLTPEAYIYMVSQSLRHVDERGEGWHEEIIGEFEHERTHELGEVTAHMEELLEHGSLLSQQLRTAIERARRNLVARHMIDIEPNYILSLQRADLSLFSEADRERLQRAAGYLLRTATERDIITFKKVPRDQLRTRHEEYHREGNWRDSEMAYLNVDPVIAPYDVNAALYPCALQTAAEHAKFLGIDRREVIPLIAKWEAQKEKFKFVNADGRSAYSLALHGATATGPLKAMRVNHIDESYAFFYGDPSEADAVSFSQRLLDPNYFCTPSGPALVGKNDGYSTLLYHGRVTWTKQTAFVVGGLHRYMQRHQQSLDPKNVSLIRRALLETCRTSLNAYFEMGMVPELHYDRDGRPHPYSDQLDSEGPMNKVQLWSAMGLHRIVEVYAEIYK